MGGEVATKELDDLAKSSIQETLAALNKIDLSADALGPVRLRLDRAQERLQRLDLNLSNLKDEFLRPELAHSLTDISELAKDSVPAETPEKVRLQLEQLSDLVSGFIIIINPPKKP
jgi:hypothetical protein